MEHFLFLFPSPFPMYRFCFFFIFVLLSFVFLHILLHWDTVGGDGFRRIWCCNRGVSEAAADVAPAVPTSSLHEGAGAAEHGAADYQDHRGGPAQIYGLAQLSFVLYGHIGVVEFLDDGVGGPGNGNQNTQTGDDEENTAGKGDPGLGPAVVSGTGGALHAAAGHGAGEPAHENGQTHEGAGRLDVRRQGQHGVVGFTLHLARGLVDAAHPDAFPRDLRGQDVVADEGRDLPLRQGRHGDGHDPAGHRAGEADQLQPSVHHGRRILSTPSGSSPGIVDVFQSWSQSFALIRQNPLLPRPSSVCCRASQGPRPSLTLSAAISVSFSPSLQHLLTCPPTLESLSRYNRQLSLHTHSLL